MRVILFLACAVACCALQASDTVDFYQPVDDPARNPMTQQFATMTPGQRVPSPPQQQATVSKRLKHHHYQLVTRDLFNIQGMVLSKRHYLGDARADIAPYDLVLDWQRMSDPAQLQHISIRQNNRFYYWKVDDPTLSNSDIARESTNLHIIPANEQIRAQIETLERGQIVELEGTLVDVHAADGFVWHTSRSRNDIGDGACEILLVKHITHLKDQQ